MNFIRKKVSEGWTPAVGVTQGMLMEFLACRERARLAYKECLSSEQTSNSLMFGTLFHDCLEQQYKNFGIELSNEYIRNNSISINKACKNYQENIKKEKLWTIEDEQTFQINKGFLQIILPVYWNKYIKEDNKKIYLAIEEEFSNPWVTNVPLRGKIDIAYEQNGEVWIMDHKTSSNLDYYGQDGLSFNFQGMFYIANWWLKTGVLPAGFIQNVIKRPSLRKGQNESVRQFIERVKKDVDDSYFKRIRVTISQKEFDFWYKKEFTPIMRELLAWDSGMVDNYRNPSACETKYGQCKYLRVCGTNNYSGLYKRKKIFPELS